MFKTIIWAILLSLSVGLSQTTSAWGRRFLDASGDALLSANIDLYTAGTGTKVYDLVESVTVAGYYSHSAVVNGLYDIYINTTKQDAYDDTWIGDNLLSLIAGHVDATGAIGATGIQDASVSLSKTTQSFQDWITGEGGGGGGGGYSPDESSITLDGSGLLAINTAGITQTHIQNSAIGSNQLANSAVTLGKIADGAVGAGALGAQVVEDENIALGAVGATQLGGSTLGSVYYGNGAGITFGQLPTESISNAAITNAKLGLSSVGTTIIANNAVTADKIPANTITASELQSGSVTTTEILDLTVAMGDLEQTLQDAINASGGGDLSYGSGPSSPVDRVYVDNNGDVGIGTFTPLQEFTIDSGSVQLDSTMSANKEGIIYKGAVPFLHDFNYGFTGAVTTEGHNIFLGKGSGNLTTGATASQTTQSSRNIVIGDSSGRALTTGYNNIFLGNNTGIVNTAGFRNIFIGSDVGLTNLSGDNSTFVGHQSGLSNVGNNNSFFGYLAGYGNTTGDYNTSIGSHAGYFIADGVTLNATADSSIYIGVNTKASGLGVVNEIVIGSNVIGIGSNSITLGDTNNINTRLNGVTQINYDGINTDPVVFRRAGDTSTRGSKLSFNRSRGQLGSPSILIIGDVIGDITFDPYIGSWGGSGSRIYSTVTRIPTEFVPGLYYSSADLRFSTADSALGVTERMRINDSGGISIGNNYVSSDPDTNNVIIEGNVGIGTTTPTSELEIAGQVTITGGTPGINKVLTSDATGLATWEEVNSSIATIWSSQTPPESNFWEAITYGHGLFVAVSSNGTNRIMTSTDGVNWNSQVAPVNNSWVGITYGNGLFVVVSSDGTNQVMTSPDGINWTIRSNGVSSEWRSVVYGNRIFVVTATDGTNRVMTSPDGINWTARTAASADEWFEVTYGNGLFVSISITGYLNKIMTSPDGITWTARASLQNNSWVGITYGNGLFVVVSSDGTNQVITSSDGITWTLRLASESNLWRTVGYGDGLFVAASDDSVIMVSLNGIDWTTRAVLDTNYWRSIAYGNGIFAMIANNGISTSGVQKETVQSEYNSNIFLDKTSFSNLDGIIYKGHEPWLWSYDYGDNGSVTTDGFNIFLGLTAGNHLMGSTATLEEHSSYNIFVGDSIGNSATTAYGNTVMGINAAYNLTTGFNNVISGRNSGVGITTGSGNVLIGHNSGTTITTATNNTLIGSDIVASASGVTNENVFGYSAVGAGSNTITLGNTSIDSVIINGQVKITGGTPFDGGILTSNADGLATWELASAVSDESVEDLAGAMVSGNTETGITVTYDDFDGTLDFIVDSKTYSHTWGVMDTTIAGEILTGWKVPANITITEIAAFTDANTVTFNLEERGETTPNTVGTDVMTADLVADNNQQEQTSFSNAAISVDSWLIPTISATGDVNNFSISIKYTYD